MLTVVNANYEIADLPDMKRRYKIAPFVPKGSLTTNVVEHHLEWPCLYEKVLDGNGETSS